MRIDVLQADDWPAVQAIYEEGLATGMATFETQSPTWEEWDRGHLANCRLAARGIAASGELGRDSVDREESRRDSSRLLGWAALSPFSRRAAYHGVAEVSIYVAVAARGQGVGKALLAELIAQSEAAGIWMLQAAIFACNAPSLALHRACGFREVGRRERIAQRDGIWHDTILLELRSNRF